MENAAYRELVLNIYQAVSEPERWQVVLDTLTDLVSARGCMLYEWDMRGGTRSLTVPLMSSDFEKDRSLIEAYFQRFRKWEAQDHDAFDQRLLERDGIDLLSEEILYKTGDEAEYRARPHVQELLKYDIRYRTGTLLDKDNPFRARFSFSMSEARGPFSQQDLALLRDVLPHLAKALELGRPMSVAAKDPVGRLSEDHQALSAIIQELTVGVCLLDSHGCVVLKNAEFQRQGEALRAFSEDAKGRLRLHESADRAQFARLLEDALNHGRFGARPRKEAIVIEAGDAVTLCVEIVPLEKSELIADRPLNGALVISRDTGRPVKIDVGLAERAFDLTQTESKVVSLVCDGLTNSEIADQRGRSVETINAQMKSILG
ncbi:MAG: hypothetical protein AAFQ21_12760, partial [Pseudomonadota bacterium]